MSKVAEQGTPKEGFHIIFLTRVLYWPQDCKSVRLRLKMELQMKVTDFRIMNPLPMNVFQVTREKELKIGSDCAGLMEGSSLLKTSSQAKARETLH